MRNLLSLTLLALTGYSQAQSQATFEEPVRIHADGQPIKIEYGYTFPASIDLDKDGLKDLVVGEYRKGGELYFYKNIGSKNTPKYAKAKNLMVGTKALVVPGVGH